MASLPGAAMKKSSGYGSALSLARAISVSARAGDSGSLGCGSGQPYSQRALAAQVPPGTQLAEKQELVRNNGSEPASLDPHKVESDVEFNIISDLFEGLVKERLEDGLVLSSPGLMHPLKVDPDASVVDNVPVWVALRPEKIMLCDEPPADGYNFAVGEVIHIAYLGDLSIYHVRLQSGQMISAQLQNEHRHRKGTPTWGDEVRLCWDADSCVVLTV